MKQHTYAINIEWTGNSGEGTKNYTSYSRNHTISANEKYDAIHGSSDPSFLGDKTRYNPEDLFLSSIASCHMLWYLHLCTVHHITVIAYLDAATALLEEGENGSGKFTQVTLHPKVKITDSRLITKANELHKEANNMCFIANSCNFSITHRPETTTD